MSTQHQIRWRVNGQLYGTLTESHRTVFVAAALDMLELVYPYVWAEHKPRIDAVIRYARIHDLNALRKRFDEYVNAVDDRQKSGAISNLYSALNEWCGYKAPKIGLVPNLLTKIIYVIVISGVGLVGGTAVAHFIVKQGGSRPAASVALFATIAVWLFGVVPLIPKSLAGRRVPAFLRNTFFNQKTEYVPSPSAYGAEPIVKARVTGQQYAKFSNPVRMAFVVGALDMLCLDILFVPPKHYSQFEAMIISTSAFKTDDLVAQFDEYFAAHESLPQQAAVVGLFTALEDWSKPGVQLSAVLQAPAVSTKAL